MLIKMLIFNWFAKSIEQKNSLSLTKNRLQLFFLLEKKTLSYMFTWEKVNMYCFRFEWFPDFQLIVETH